MLNTDLIDLGDCNELSHVMRRRPAMLAHGTLLVLGALLGIAGIWLVISTAKLVVVAQGVVRPLQETHPVVSGEAFSAGTSNRIVRVEFVQGQRVAKGDILICFETTWLDREIASRKKAIQSGNAELLGLRKLERKIKDEFAGKHVQAEMLLAQANFRLADAKYRHEKKMTIAAVEVKTKKDLLERTRVLLAKNAISKREFRDAQDAADRAAAEWQLSQLPVDASDIAVLEQRKKQVQQQHQVQNEKLLSQREVRNGEIERTKIELGTLQLKRDQARVVAPVDGIIITLAPKIGDVIAAGETIAEIASGRGLRLDVAVSTKDIGHIKVGMPVRVKLNAFDYQRYGTLSGIVSFISPDSSVSGGDHANELPVFLAHIELDQNHLGRGQHTGVAKIGMVGVAEIATEQRTLMSLLATRIDRVVRID